MVVSFQRNGHGSEPFLRCSTRWKRGKAPCSNKMTVRAELLDSGLPDALKELLDESVIAEAIERALTQLHGQEATPDYREGSGVDPGEQRLIEAIERGDAPEAILEALKSRQARRKTLEIELADLRTTAKLARLTTAEITCQLEGRLADLRGLLFVGSWMAPRPPRSGSFSGRSGRLHRGASQAPQRAPRYPVPGGALLPEDRGRTGPRP